MEKDIQNLLNMIKNTTVRSYYEKEFKLELKKFTKEMMYKNKNSERKNMAPTFQVSIVPTLSPYLSEAKMLLTYLILFPHLYGDYMERLTYLKITDKKLIRLHEILSNELTENPTITCEEFKTLLETKYSKNIFIYLATELETLERAEKTPMEARIEFEQRIKALELVLLDEEIKNLMAEFSKNPTNELWVQILSLKQEKEKSKETI